MNIIVMTGGTSGFGAVAAKQLLLSENNRLILGVHHKQISGAEMLDLDLASLDSVRSFASRVTDLIGTAQGVSAVDGSRGKSLFDGHPQPPASQRHPFVFNA